MIANARKKTVNESSYLLRIVVKSFLIAILCVVGFAAIALSCYYVDLLVNVKNGKSTNPLFATYVIVSPSMVPTIKVNDAIFIKRVDNDDYKVGDIITFSSADTKYEGLTVTHRIVNKELVDTQKSIYTTKGDNNLYADPAAVQTNSIYGKVLFRIPKIGYFQKFISNPLNLFICILIPSLIVLIYDGYRIVSSFVRYREA